MKTNPNEPIMALPLAPNGMTQTTSDMVHLIGMGALMGLTKLEYFTAMAMAGYCAHVEIGASEYENIALHSVNQAKAVIKALNK